MEPLKLMKEDYLAEREIQCLVRNVNSGSTLPILRTSFKILGSYLKFLCLSFLSYKLRMKTVLSIKNFLKMSWYLASTL